MHRIGWTISTLTALGAGLALSACGDARPFVGGGDGGGSACTGCHGTDGRTGILPGTDVDLAAAPPIAPAGEPAQVVGAHQAHLNPDPAANPFTGPIACAECHAVPTDFAHATNPPASPVDFSHSTLARTGGAAPAWNSTDKTTSTTCSNVYCHGNFTFGNVTGTLVNAPDWTLGGGQAACGSCHGLPPTGHIALGGTPTAATCNGCHPDTVDANGKIIVDAAGHSRHINGQKDVAAASCTTCHGTAGRTGTLPGTDANLAAAPPLAPPGEPTQVVGAHQAHLNPAATGSFAGPVACSECHVVPTDSAHAGSPPPSPVDFGTSTLARTGGASPVWNSTDKTTNTTCSNVYCHGNFAFGGVTGTVANAPDWTGTNQATCGSCHDLPPVGHIALPGTPTAATCSGCHPATVAANGTILVDTATGLSKHVDGLAEEGAHADPSWLTASGGDHTAAALNQSPPFATCLVCHNQSASGSPEPFGAADPTDVAGSSCNACHASALAGAATTDWTQNCVFCHGDKTNKLLTYTVADQTSDPWIIAPPTGVQGETLTTSIVVGAHQKHANPGTGFNVLSNAIACTECHPSWANPPSGLPTDLAHVDGVPDVPLAGPLAAHPTGSFTPSPTWDAGTAGCAATYCHGNYPQGGNVATPVWTTVDGSWATCTSCHGAPPDTGEHVFHITSVGRNCLNCHQGIATGSGASVPVTNAAIVLTGGLPPPQHVNGSRDVVFGGTFAGNPVTGTWTPAPTSSNAAGGSCNVSCHSGSRSW